MQILIYALDTQGFLDTNLLVLALQNACVGGYAQCETQMGLRSGGTCHTLTPFHTRTGVDQSAYW